MAKKKKSQLKPVARGFATVSVAKKVTPIEEELKTEVAPTTQTEGSTTSEGTENPFTHAVQSVNDQWDSEKAEEQSLQNLIDQFQDRVEKEIVRTVKVLGTTPSAQ